MQIVPTSEKVLLTSGNIDIPFVDGVQIVSLTGSPAINGSLVVRLDPSATPVIGTTVIFSYEGAATQGGGGTITIMSATPNIAEAWWTKKLNIHSVYTASGWVTKVFVSASESGWIENTDLIDGSIALTKFANGTSAYIIVYNGSGVPTAVAMSGVVAISNAGVTTIVAGSIVNADISASAAIALSKLAVGTSAQIIVCNGAGVPVYVAASGDITISNTGVVTIANNAVTTVKILDANVTLAKLASGITPSHIIKFAGQRTTVGGAAAEAFVVTGALAATDIAFCQIVNNGTSNVTILQAVVTNDTLTVTFSADPVADTVFNYQIIRAAS